MTSGRLWKLYKAIDTGTSPSEMPSEKKSLNGLNAYQRKRLRQLSVELQVQGHGRLAVDLEGYLDEDAKGKQYPSKQYKDLMAEEVVEAIKNRKTIYLSCLEGTNPYRGVFVTDAALEPPSHVFTAWSRAGFDGKALDDVYAERLLDQIVSLEVDITGHTFKGLPRLEAKRWINKLCFFDGDPARDVTFNYPSSLTS